MYRNLEFNYLAEKGIVLHEAVQDYYGDGWAHNLTIAMDAQPTLVTTANAGVPAYLTNYIDPKFVEIMVAPMAGAQILGEAKRGDWTTLSTTFTVVENTGEVSSYGDYNKNGSAGINTTFPERQSYYFQTITQWGERELDMAGLARIDYASRLNVASALVINKFMNRSYFFGVSGLKNYGLLNDPQLTTPVAPSTKAAGGQRWTAATPNEIFLDIQALFALLVAQSMNNLKADDRMKLCLSGISSIPLMNTNPFGLNVYGMLKQAFPNMEVITAVEYTTTSGELVQLIAESVGGQDVGFCAFNEKMRAHRVVPDLSSYKQKKSAGTWGAVIQQPFAIAQMLGV